MPKAKASKKAKIQTYMKNPPMPEKPEKKVTIADLVADYQHQVRGIK